MDLYKDIFKLYQEMTLNNTITSKVNTFINYAKELELDEAIINYIQSRKKLVIAIEKEKYGLCTIKDVSDLDRARSIAHTNYTNMLSATLRNSQIPFVESNIRKIASNIANKICLQALNTIK